MNKKSLLAAGIVLVIVLTFLFRFEIFYSYNIIENQEGYVNYRTNRITGEVESFDGTGMLWLSQKDMINEQINELQRRIEGLLETREEAIARKIENDQGEDEPKGLIEQWHQESLEVNGDGLDGYQVNIEKLKNEIKALELQLRDL